MDDCTPSGTKPSIHFIPFCIFPTALCHMCFDYVLHWPHYINSNYRFLLIPCDWDRPNPHNRKSNLFLPNKDMIPLAWYFETRKKTVGSNIDSYQFFCEFFSMSPLFNVSICCLITFRLQTNPNRVYRSLCVFFLNDTLIEQGEQTKTA